MAVRSKSKLNKWEHIRRLSSKPASIAAYQRECKLCYPKAQKKALSAIVLVKSPIDLTEAQRQSTQVRWS